MSSAGDAAPAGVPAGEGPPAPVAPVALQAPRDGVPPLVTDEGHLARAAESLAAGTGPLAIDAERASGYRYGQRAYLVQLRRAGSGTWLVDPIACPDLAPIARAVHGVEWVLHAATQDLPCLAAIGLRPASLFDTELAARLVNLPRVGLAAVVEHYLGLTLAKEHSAVDWSRRPLPEPWLRYAALDVELLIELRDHLEAELLAHGKREWAQQEFAALLSFTGPAPRAEPWRRTSGMHRIRSPRAAAVVRELWLERDRIAQEKDQSPGRILPDAALVELTVASLRATDERAGAATAPSYGRRFQRSWRAAVDRALGLPESQLPVLTARAEGPPPARSWIERDPLAAKRLATARAGLVTLAHELNLPVENLLSPDTVRRLLWQPPAPVASDVEEALRRLGARPWQVQLTMPVLLGALQSELATEQDSDADAVVTDQ